LVVDADVVAADAVDMDDVGGEEEEEEEEGNDDEETFLGNFKVAFLLMLDSGLKIVSTYRDMHSPNQTHNIHSRPPCATAILWQLASDMLCMVHGC
jgi:hypothetical protein